MEEWKEYKLGDICSIVGRIGFRGYTTDDLTNSPKDGAITLSPTNIVQGEIDMSKPTYIKWPKYYESPEIMLAPGDIVLVKTGSSIGRTAYIREIIHPMTLNPQFVVLKNIKVNPVFLSYIIKSPYFQALLKSITVGSAIPTLSQKNLAKLIIQIPDESCQNRIASILKSLDDKIEVNRRINENLEQQAQALFEVLMDEELPRNRVLNDYAFINPTRSMKKGEIARYIDMSSLPTKGSFPSDWVNKPYNGGMKFQNGDTLMARITPCLENGKTAYINFLEKDEIAFGSTEYIVMAPHEGIPSEMFYFLARNEDFVSYAVAHMNGSSGRQRVSAADIENFNMPNIPSNLIAQFGMKAKTIMETIKTNSLESRRLAELRDTLLPRLMSGELKVCDIKI